MNKKNVGGIREASGYTDGFKPGRLFRFLASCLPLKSLVASFVAKVSDKARDKDVSRPLFTVHCLLCTLLLLAALAPQAEAAARTTIGNGNWSSTAIWDGASQKPQAGDTVTIGHNVTLDESTPALSCLTVDANKTLTCVGMTIKVEATTVTVNGTITHPVQTDGTAPWVPDNRVWIQCTSLTVADGGKIDVKYMGYAGRGSDGGSGIYGKGPGAGWYTYHAGGGAGYGGAGGTGFQVQANNNGGPANGLATDPTDAGSSGGGLDATSYSGSGGGIVRIEATGAVTVNGEINADGQNGNAKGGAGSGGSIYITCSTIQGVGSLHVVGGIGGQLSDAYGGSGGGGRMRIDVTNPTAQGGLTAPRMSAAGGIASGSSGYAGGSGTIHMSDISALSGVFSGGATITAAQVSGGTTASDLTFDSGVFVLPATNWNLTVGGNLLLTNTATLQVYPSLAGDATVTVGGEMKVRTGCTYSPFAASITASPWTYKSVLNKVNKLTIDSGGIINANGLGYAGGWSDTVGGYTAPSGPGAGRHAQWCAGGGAYGGDGGDGYANSSRNDVNGYAYGGGDAYGTIYAPTYPGSGGGAGRSGYSGNGGGVVRIEASGTVRVDGSISANGQASGGTGNGGAAGGCISITCKKWEGTGGLVSADGGDGSSSQGGGGGGGRIAIWDQVKNAEHKAQAITKATYTQRTLTQYQADYDTFDTGSLHATAGTSPGAPAYCNGQDGTAYFFIPPPLPPKGTVVSIR
jgi:hypothetical protein